MLTHDASHKMAVSKQQERINQGVHADSSTMPLVKELQFIPWHDGDLLHTLIVFWHSPGNASQPPQVSFPWGKATNLSINVKETRVWNKIQHLENTFSLSELQPYPLDGWVPTRAKALVQILLSFMLHSSSLTKDTERSLVRKIFLLGILQQVLTIPDAPGQYLKAGYSPHWCPPPTCGSCAARSLYPPAL